MSPLGYSCTDEAKQHLRDLNIGLSNEERHERRISNDFNKIVLQLLITLPFCKCDCGKQVTKPQNVYIAGHNNNNLIGNKSPSYGLRRSDETKKKQSEYRKLHPNKKLSPEKRVLKGSRISLSKTGQKYNLSDEARKKNSEMIKALWKSGKYKKCYEPRNETVRKNIGIAQKERFKNPEERAKISLGATLSWKKPDYISKQMLARKIRPNILESRFQNFLNKKFPNTWKYIGDGQDKEFIIGGKVPDFVNIKNKIQLIELFGDYWHQGENPQIKIEYYRKLGFDCLVIWEYEMSNLIIIIEKIKIFMEKYATYRNGIQKNI